MGACLRRSGVAVALVVLVAGPLAAQVSPVGQGPASWVAHFSALAGNAGLGALTGGILQALRGGSFADGFTRGALGGSLVYAGKRISAERFWGAGLAGREVAAVGTSVVRNAARGRPPLERLALPLGPVPVWITVELRPGFTVTPRLDVVGAAWLGFNGTDRRLDLDLSSSLSAGVPVFQADRRAIVADDDLASGVMVARTITLSDPLSRFPSDLAHTFAHERIHVVQSDFALGTWNEALMDWLLPRLPAGTIVNRYALLDVVSNLVWVWPSGLTNPWEAEAEFFAGPRGR
ncbi:MAG TPA: hypothetical protein VF970_11725 [Gemmatimonadales bacterium]